jgi:DNA-binding PadR family transcriptional regulator
VQREFAKEIWERALKNFIDILVLKELEKSTGISCYDLIISIHKKFAVLVSPGTVYATVYSLERKGLIGGTQTYRKTVYMLTDKGKEALEGVKKSKSEFQSLMTIVF